MMPFHASLLGNEKEFILIWNCPSEIDLPKPTLLNHHIEIFFEKVILLLLQKKKKIFIKNYNKLQTRKNNIITLPKLCKTIYTNVACASGPSVN
jgi:hypothetical protein